MRQCRLEDLSDKELDSVALAATFVRMETGTWPDIPSEHFILTYIEFDDGRPMLVHFAWRKLPLGGKEVTPHVKNDQGQKHGTV